MTFRRRRRRPVRIQVLNGLKLEHVGMDCVVELVPGEDVLITSTHTFLECDRGFTSEDGVHRLHQVDREFPTYLRLLED